MEAFALGHSAYLNFSPVERTIVAVVCLMLAVVIMGIVGWLLDKLFPK